MINRWRRFAMQTERVPASIDLDARTVSPNSIVATQSVCQSHFILEPTRLHTVIT